MNRDISDVDYDITSSSPYQFYLQDQKKIVKLIDELKQLDVSDKKARWEIFHKLEWLTGCLTCPHCEAVNNAWDTECWSCRGSLLDAPPY